VLPEALESSDVVIGVSHSGETDEIVRLMERAKERKVTTIAITNYESSPLARAAEVILYTTYNEDLLGSYSPAARVAELALVVALVERIGEMIGGGP
jgi:DNA-binding MurR/RpiR family transcriptional regulator